MHGKRLDLFPHTTGERDQIDSRDIGRRIVLPSSFTGSRRYYFDQYQNALAIVRHFGKPDLFITIAANPKWPEIVANLLPGQSSIDRPDLVARVFHLKLEALLEDLLEKDVLGKVGSH